MGNIISPAGPYDHNPFVGNRPMKVPLTFAAEYAQFPWVYHWRYWIYAKPLVYAQLFINIPLFYYLQRKCKYECLKNYIFPVAYCLLEVVVCHIELKVTGHVKGSQFTVIEILQNNIIEYDEFIKIRP